MNKDFLISKLSIIVIFLAILNFLSSAKARQSSSEPKPNPGSQSQKTITPKPTSIPRISLKTPPVRYQLIGGTHTFQTFNNCGPASLSMVLSFYNVFETQIVLGDDLRPYQIPGGDNDDKSVTLPELAEKSKDFGFTAYHRPNGNIDVIKNFIANDIPVITRTLTKVSEDIGHYRVVYGYDDTTQELIQNDSLQGSGLKFSYEHFLTLWKPYGYEYLVLVPPEKEALAKAILADDADELTAWKNAVENLESEANQNPNDIFLKFSLSVAYFNSQEYERSVELFESVEGQLPFRTLWYQIEPLYAYQKLGRYEKLLPRIEKVLLNYNRAFSELYQMRGEIYLEQGKAEEAKSEFEKAIFYNKNYEPAKEALKIL